MSHPGKETWKEKVRKEAYRLETIMSNHYSDGRLAITQRMAVAVHIPPEKLWGIWPSGAEIENFSKAGLSRIWPSTTDAIRMIYHGTLHYERNLITLCHAMARANLEGMIFELSMVGDGTARVELEDFAAQSKGRIRVVSLVKYENIPDLLAKSNVGVLPFPDEEKFRVSSPIKLFEYMAAGLPILATRIVCHTDVIGNGDYVIWAEDSSEQALFESLCHVWRLRNELSQMGNRAAVAAEKWSWKASADKLNSALEIGIESLDSGNAAR
jgi:glycosyltransferase involved in cell wall biosynthesis